MALLRSRLTRRTPLLAFGALALACSGEEKVDLATFLERETSRYGERQEEELIRYFFGDERDGFYLDVGCAHYKDGSTTFYLEEHLGWRGIGVDAEPGWYGDWKKHRPNSRFVHFAVTDESGGTITLHRAGGLSATDLDTTNLDHWKSIKDNVKSIPLRVRTITIDDLLDRLGITEIDFFSIDINGAEPIALAGFDIERFRPRLVHVEANPHRRDELWAYFTSRGYERIDAYLEFDEVNWYFRPMP